MFHLQNSAAAFLRKFSQSRSGAVFLIFISVHDVSIGVLGQPFAGLAAAVAAAVGLAGQFLDEGVFLLFIGFSASSAMLSSRPFSRRVFRMAAMICANSASHWF